MNTFALVNQKDLKLLLDNAYAAHANPSFIEADPIQVPRAFQQKEDIEISGFLTATIAWGQRQTIIKNANRIMELMDWSPYDFVIGHTPSELKIFDGFVHRTFNSIDLAYFISRLKSLYLEHQGLEGAFLHGKDMHERIAHFHQLFFEPNHPKRTEKHVSNPFKGSSAKRLNMYLRWMVRSNIEGVDFGLWKSIETSELMMPLDVHTGNVGRKLGLLKRQQNDWKAVEELTASLRKFDFNDPVKYDLALFGLGVNKMI